MKDVLISFFPISIILFYYYFSLVWLLEVRTSNTMLKRIGENLDLDAEESPLHFSSWGWHLQRVCCLWPFLCWNLFLLPLICWKVFVLLVFKSCKVVEFDSSEFFVCFYWDDCKVFIFYSITVSSPLFFRTGSRVCFDFLRKLAVMSLSRPPLLICLLLGWSHPKSCGGLLQEKYQNLYQMALNRQNSIWKGSAIGRRDWT